MKKNILSFIIGLFFISTTSASFAETAATIKKENQEIGSSIPEKYKDITTSGGKLVRMDSSIRTALTLIAKNASGFYTGKQKDGVSPIIIFFDPECPYCKMLWSEVEKIKDSPYIFWVPVGIMDGEKSEKESSILLENINNPKIIMDKLVKKENILDQKFSEENFKNIQRNNLLFGTLKFNSVPIIFKTTKDDFFYMQNGFLTKDKFEEISNY